MVHPGFFIGDSALKGDEAKPEEPKLEV